LSTSERPSAPATEQRRGQRWRFTLVERPKGGFEADNLELLFDDPPPPGR
jgi:hypothetical protein